MRIHVSLNVTSMERSLAFYSALFGVEASKIKPDYANYRLDEPPIHLALMERSAAAGEGVNHLGIELADIDSLHQWRKRLELAGTDFAIEDKAECCYAKADKLWVTDPDGYKWEIWVRTGEYQDMGETRVAVSA